MNKITLLNIDDLIRKEKKSHLGNRVRIHWGKDGFDILRKFTKSDTYLGAEHELDESQDYYRVSTDKTIEYNAI